MRPVLLLRSSILIAALACTACSESISSVTCEVNETCSEGYLCGPEGRCVTAAPLEVQALVLPQAYVDEPYLGALVRASGGIAPFSWRVESLSAGGLEWLEMVSDSGELRNRAGETPALSGEFRLQVIVSDRSNAGQGAESARVLTLLINESHCGPNPCPDGQLCCAAACVDVSSAQRHCGTCGRSCADLPNTLGAACQDGLCVIAECAQGHLDCDGDPLTGCETAQGDENCSACGDDCTDLSVYLYTRDVRCEDGQCLFGCQDRFADCDYARPGCETSLLTIGNCGECGASCEGDSTGLACVMGLDGPGCGCQTGEHCPAGTLCCASACIAPDALHCGACDAICSPATGGAVCHDASGVGDGPFACRCFEDDDCHGQLFSSDAACSGVTGQCACGDGPACAGSAGDACCGGACVDLTGDPAHCGSCGAACAAGQTCQAGVCTCAAGAACPALSGAVDCQGDLCGCAAAGGQACPAGQLCCPGPLPAAQGCCRQDCAEQAGDDGRVDCSSTCMPPKVWCAAGCCDSCDPADAGTCR